MNTRDKINKIVLGYYADADPVPEKILIMNHRLLNLSYLLADEIDSLHKKLDALILVNVKLIEGKEGE